MNTLLVTAYTSGYGDLADRLEASDLRGENGRTANWHDGYAEKPANESVYDRFLESFRWASRQCRARVVVLEVKAGDSRLDCWEKRLAEEVL